MEKTNSIQGGCVGDCPNTCKAHMGEYIFCTNEGCVCHSKPQEKKWCDYGCTDNMIYTKCPVHFLTPKPQDIQPEWEEAIAYFAWYVDLSREQKDGMKSFIRQTLQDHKQRILDGFDGLLKEPDFVDENHLIVWNSALSQTRKVVEDTI